MRQFIPQDWVFATMNRSMRIVTFGNSLTVGYQSPSFLNPRGESTPYGQFLQELLGDSAQVLIRGVSGELTADMALRLDRDIIALKPDYAVILGGSNDLGWGLQPKEVMQNLVAMYERVRSKGIQPVATTVPSIRGFDSLIPPRKVLNNLMIEYCRTQEQPFVDLFMATAEPETLRLAEHCSNDGLHLTTEGYRRLAELLYHGVFKPAV
jgi:lysophospholipase L1-like esterase